MGSTAVTTVADLVVGDPQAAVNLTMFPLSGNAASSLEYLLVDELLAAGKVVVEEVSDAGSVPELRLTNHTSNFVLIVDGTELVGAKQNRIVNSSFLIPPVSVTKIPVSCVEQGRWRYRSRRFEKSRFHSPHSIRRHLADYQKSSLKAGAGHRSDQGEVWARVAHISNKMAAPTETGALNDIYAQREERLKEYAEKIRLNGRETGAAFFVGGRFAGLDLFDRPATLAALFEKILFGVALEAAMEADAVAPPSKPTGAKVSGVLKEIAGALFEKYEPVGAGEDWRYEGKLSLGKALHYHGELIHLSAFGR